jgi:hypothetical protein
MMCFRTREKVLNKSGIKREAQRWVAATNNCRLQNAGVGIQVGLHATSARHIRSGAQPCVRAERSRAVPKITYTTPQRYATAHRDNKHARAISQFWLFSVAPADT